MGQYNEPWRIGKDRDVEIKSVGCIDMRDLVDSRKFPVGQACGAELHDRIVRCVNFCRHLSNEFLDKWTFPEEDGSGCHYICGGLHYVYMERNDQEQGDAHGTVR